MYIESLGMFLACSSDNFIAGSGMDAYSKQFSYLGHITFDARDSSMANTCIGTAISKLTVMTSARCLESKKRDENSQFVIFGKTVRIFEMAAMPFPCNGLLLCCVNWP